MKQLIVLAAVLACVGMVQAFDRVALCEEAYDEAVDSCAGASQMMDRIAGSNHPGRVIPVEWHVDRSYPLYSDLGENKMDQYPPPANGGYYEPWLWVDGHSAYDNYAFWESYVATELAQSSDIGITLTGTYNNLARTGNVEATLVNVSGDAITANVYFVITEDTINYAAPNGDNLHNHVCRACSPMTASRSIRLRSHGSRPLAGLPRTSRLRSSSNRESDQIPASACSTCARPGTGRMRCRFGMPPAESQGSQT